MFICGFLSRKRLPQSFNVLSFDSCKSHWRGHKWAVFFRRNLEIFSVNMIFGLSGHTLTFVMMAFFFGAQSSSQCFLKYTEIPLRIGFEDSLTRTCRNSRLYQRDARICISICLLKTPFPPSLSCDLWPNLDSSFFTVCQKILWKRPSLAVPLWNIPLQHSTMHHPAALALCISFLSGICLLNPTNQQRIDAYCA